MANQGTISREKVCPFLLRCFWKYDQNNKAVSYDRVIDEIYPSNEVQIYTWPDATLREITDLLNAAIISQHENHVSFNYNIVYPNNSGTFVMKPLGRINMKRQGADDKRTLSQLKFEPGDYLDVAVMRS